MNPKEIAKLSCDKHVVKIQLEICQMLYTAWFFSGQEEYVREHAPLTKDGSKRGYKPAHKKHPHDHVDRLQYQKLYVCLLNRTRSQ